MTIYPIGHPVAWRSDIPPRQGSQRGKLSHPWHRYESFPWVIWDGETDEHQQLPECVGPVNQVVSSTRNAWMEAKR